MSIYPAPSSTLSSLLRAQQGLGRRRWVAADFVHQGRLAQWRAAEARVEQEAMIPRLAGGEDAKLAERFYELTWLLAEAAAQRGEHKACMRLLQSGLSHSGLDRHRTFFAGWLARHAATRGDVDAARAWLAHGNPEVDDLLAHSSLALGASLLVKKPAEVFAALGRPGDPLLLHPSDMGEGLLVRGIAAEAVGAAGQAARDVFGLLDRLGPRLMGDMELARRRLQHPAKRGFFGRVHRAQKARRGFASKWNIGVHFIFGLAYGLGGLAIMRYSWLGETNWWGVALGALGPLIGIWMHIGGFKRIHQLFRPLGKLDGVVTSVTMGDSETVQSAEVLIDGRSAPVSVIVQRATNVDLAIGDFVLLSPDLDGSYGFILWR
jgi:hypothetical protein